MSYLRGLREILEYEKFVSQTAPTKSGITDLYNFYLTNFCKKPYYS